MKYVFLVNRLERQKLNVKKSRRQEKHLLKIHPLARFTMPQQVRLLIEIRLKNASASARFYCREQVLETHPTNRAFLPGPNTPGRLRARKFTAGFRVASSMARAGFLSFGLS